MVAFSSFTQKHTFAPNLTKLAIIALKISVQEYIHWVNIFLSPSLLNLELEYYGDQNRFGFDSALVSAFLEPISTKCSKLQRLEIFPRADDYEFEWGPETKPTKADRKRSEMLVSLNTHLSSFRSLRSLKSSALVLMPMILSTLGELPALEMLSINGDSREPRIVDLVVPDSAFSALHTLELHNFHWANLRYMSKFTPLLRRLKKIVMTMAYNDNLSFHGWDDDDGENDWPFKLIQSVAKNAPLLVDLTVDYSTDECEAYFSSDWLDCLRDLSLRRLDIRNVGIECRWSEFASALPSLEEFRTLHLDLGTISRLAKLVPRLQLLELDSINIREFNSHEEFGENYDEDEDEVDEDDEHDDEEQDDEEDEEHDNEEGESDEDHQGEGREGKGSEKSKATRNPNDKSVSKSTVPLYLKAAYQNTSKTPIGNQELQEIAR